jgi:RNA polymerase sigma-70 factor (ECF subfamily)
VEATEADLVRRLRAGDEAAFETLVREQGGRMLGVARRVLRNEHDARDAVQEAFVSAYRAIDRFEEGARLSTWLHRITLNAALMKIRAAKRRPEESIDDLQPKFRENGHHVEPPAPWEDRPDAVLEREDRIRFVRAAIDRLPEIHRTVLLLRDVDGFDTGEAAEALGISENAVKVRLHRARLALRTQLDRRFRKETR